MSQHDSAHPPTSDSPADARFLRVDWTVRTVARIVFTAIILAACLGVFGRGPVSRASASVEGVQLSHDRFLREQGRFRMRLTPRSDRVEIVLRGVIDPGDEVRCVPEPVSDLMRSGERHLVVPAEAGREASIEVRWKPETPGVRTGTIEVDGRTFEVWSMAYP